MTDSFGFGKNISLAMMALIGLILWVVKLITGTDKIVKTNKLFWLFLVLVIWSGITFFRLETGARMVSLMSPLGMGSVISLFVLFFLWLQVNDSKESKKQFLFLTISGIITGIGSLIVFLLPANKMPLLIPKTNPWVSISTGWSLTGSMMAEASLFIFLILGWLKKLLKKVKEKSDFKAYLMEAVAVVFFSLLFLLDVYRIFKAGWIFLDLTSSWVIAVEAFKNKAIFGMGIGNFIEAFNSYRPVSFNLTKYWSASFSGASMGILQIWTELGIVGLILTFYLVAMVLKLKGTKKFLNLVLFLAICLFLPLNLVTVFLLVWILSNGVVESKETKLILNVGEKGFNAMPYILGVLILIGVGYSGFLTTKIFLGEIYMRKSLVAASNNDGTTTYNLQNKVITSFNAKVPAYRRTFSQVNLSLASALLSNENINDEDKQKASTLVQQAVSEAKVAIALNQKDPIYWYNLAGIYKSLVGYVDGAADWSYQAYQQTVALDAANPVYYLDLGGLLYASNQYESAERAFEQAVTVKTDYANAWYNWAYAAKQQNKLSAAVTRLEQALKLVTADSTDYDAAAKELETWKAELAKLVEQQKAAAEEQQKAAAKTTEQQQLQEQQQLAPPETSTEQTQGSVPTEEKLETPVDLSTPTEEAVGTE